eukprot:1140731-Pelagomonas_calceolata.AAC.2
MVGVETNYPKIASCASKCTGQNEFEASMQACWLCECQHQALKGLHSVRGVDDPAHTQQNGGEVELRPLKDGERGRSGVECNVSGSRQMESDVYKATHFLVVLAVRRTGSDQPKAQAPAAVCNPESDTRRAGNMTAYGCWGKTAAGIHHRAGVMPTLQPSLLLQSLSHPRVYDLLCLTHTCGTSGILCGGGRDAYPVIMAIA